MAADAAARALAVLHRIADIVESRDARLAELETFDSGLPITQALGQARRAAENFRFFADLFVAQADDAFKVPGRQLELRQPQADRRRRADHAVEHAVHARVLEARTGARHGQHGRAQAGRVHAAVGVPVGRRSSRRPGLPAGVFNLVHGLGEEAGDALVKHPDVPLISFTGESRTGQLIFANAAPALKGLSMELGGKSPARRLRRRRPRGRDRRDDLRRLLAQRRALHRGSRILVQREIYDEFVERYAAQARARRRRRPARPATEVGALVHPEHYEKVMSLHRDRQDRGPRSSPAAGGPRASRPATTSRRRCSPTCRRTPGSSRRRSSARSSRSRRSTPTRRRSPSPTA